MKRINILIPLILFTFPILVKAKLNDIELIKQFHTETRYIWYGGYNVTSYKIGNYYYTYGLMAPGYVDGEYGFALFDETGKEMTRIASNKEPYIDESGTYLYAISEKNDVYSLVKINVKEFSIETVDFDFWANGLFYNENGLIVCERRKVNTKYENYYYLYNTDLEYVKEVDESFLYDKEISYTKNNPVKEEIYEDILKVLAENYNISSSEVKLNYAIEHNNQYYTIIQRLEGPLSIIYFNKDYSEMGIYPISNNSNKVYSLNVANIYSEDAGIVLQLAGLNWQCPLSTEIEELEVYGCGSVSIMQIYQDIFNIETKSDGNGIVSSTKEIAPSGELINFEVTPNEGYVLDQIKVTDTEGNILIFSENTFTMPSADVTIEATFIKKELPSNPETQDNIIFLLIIIFLSGTFILVNIKKNLSES